ncbi:30S ribosomal protein S1 [Chlorella vulgaris]
MPVPSTQACAASRAAVCARASRPAAARQLAAAPHKQARRGLQWCRAAAEAETAPEAQAAAPQDGKAGQASGLNSKPTLMTDSWNDVVQMRKDQTTIETTVERANKSGLLMPIGNLMGFLPYKLLDPSRMAQRRSDGSQPPVPPNGYQALVGTKLRVKVTQVIVPDNRLIVSEKAVLLDELASMARPGDIVEGVVGSTMDWGVFVECRTVNGKPCPRAEAVLPMRELSYSWLNSATEVVQSGQPVRVVVLFQQPAPDAKVVVSLKRLEEDPLKETLDNVLPLNNQGSTFEQLSVPASVPQGVDEILEALDREEGITSITLGRCVEERRTVSQDLELWITKETVADGYNLAVRAGKVVQEVIVGTDMGLDDMRSTVQRVLRSIN